MQFPDIAFPEQEPADPQPWTGQGPDEGSLYPPYAAALADVLSTHTRTPKRCWFCVWEGWGDLEANDAVPRVHLPARKYLLYAAPITAMPALRDLVRGHSPSLWWPDDRAWCVATEIDLDCTYLAGSAAAIVAVLADGRAETQPASPDENHHLRAPGWLELVIEQTAADLLRTGSGTLRTWRGTVTMELDRPLAAASGALRTQIHGARTQRSGWTRIEERDPELLRTIVRDSVTQAAIDLV